MKDFAGRIAVVTGGGSGMGQELVLQLVAEGCNIAMCDISAAGMTETYRLCETAGLPQGLRITTHVADVSDAAQVERFRDEVANRHDTDRVHLLFNNAGIGGGGSMIAHTREEWERTFNVCWGGVYNCTRAFLLMLQRADAGHIVNTSSVDGFWASNRAARPAHRLQCRQTCGKGLHRGADYRSAHQRTAYQMLGGHAGAHRNRDPAQLAQGPERQSIGCDGRDADRASACAHCLNGPRCVGIVGRRHRKGGRRARTPLP
jgi:NAD(P)-dependent dehydrogenase (short-subunit alcohol dehydrogenase family)